MLGFSSGGSKEFGQNLDNGSKNSENKLKDKVRPKMAQKLHFVSQLGLLRIFQCPSGGFLILSIYLGMLPTL